MRIAYLPFVFLLLGNNDCGGEAQTKYNCECWSPSSSGLTIGTPKPCANDSDEALGMAISECSSEVGESCDCTCTESDSHCGIGG